MKINTFEVTYKNAVIYTLGKIAGVFVSDQKNVDRSSIEFKRLMYANFKQDVSCSFGFPEIDRDILVVNQNELNNHGERETLKCMCRSYYYNNEVH